MKDRIMIDVSMFLYPDTLNQLIRLSKEGFLEEVVISKTFLDMIENRSFTPLSQHFEIEESLIHKEYIYDFFFSRKYSTKISPYSSELSNNHEVYKNLLNQTGDEIITQVLFEEWEFLTTNSWLIAKLRVAFDKIVEAGTTAVQMSQKAFDVTVRKTLKKTDEESLSPNDRLKATAKWVAVGGSVLGGLVPPIPGVLINAAAGYFLLCDP